MLKRIFTALLAALLPLLPAAGHAVTIAWMSDTQEYASSASPMWAEMNQWIADNAERLDIQYVFHTGDMVSASKSDKQWQLAREAMEIISERGLPFLAVTGNHDVGYRPSYKRYMDYVGSLLPMRFGQEYAETGSRYQLFSIDGRDYIFLGIAFSNGAPSHEECQWARDVLEKHSDRIAIILTHSYIKRASGHTTQGRVIYEQIVKPSDNVLLVLCGHCRGLSRRVENIDADGDGETDRRIYALMSNYQSVKSGVNGYIRFLMFRRDEICVYTYSPILDTYEFGREQTVDIIPLPDMERQNG